MDDSDPLPSLHLSGDDAPAGMWASIGLALLAALVVVVATPAWGATEWAESLRIMVDHQFAPGVGDIEIQVGEIDPRMQLAPCARLEPFVPPGAKLWGRASLGVRCVEGASWTAYVPVTIRVYAPTLVATHPIARGAELTAEDVRAERIDLTAYRSGVIGAEETIAGKVAVRAIAAGEALQRDVVRMPRILQPGDVVKVVYAGANFAIVTDGKALSTAGDGESARIAVGGSGQVLTGVARPGKVVEVR
jgi:flagella basal body P-ring formation protein FlgA